MGTDRQEPFKTCSKCEHVWACLADVVVDGTLEVNGYQASFDAPEEGLVLVTHAAEDCQTTLAVVAIELRPLYDGPEYTERKTLTDECSRQCLYEGKLEVCEAECDMAWIRRVLQYLRRHELPPHLG